MGGGKPKSSSTSFSGSGQAWAQPYATAGAGSVQSVYNQAQPGLQGLTDLTQKSLVPAITGKFNAGLEGADAARSYNMNVLQSPWGSNPQLEAMIGQQRRSVSDEANGLFARSGRYGSGAHQDLLTRNLGDMESNLRYNDYFTEMQRRSQAADSLTGANQQEFNQSLAGVGMGAELPYTGANNLANSLGSLFSGGTEKSKSKGASPIWGAIGAAAGAAASAGAASDRRLKKDIVEVGELPNGLKVYDFRYRSDPEEVTYRGVMADEVKDKVPEAYIENFNGSGHAGVNYALVGMPLLKVA